MHVDTLAALMNKMPDARAVVKQVPRETRSLQALMADYMEEHDWLAAAALAISVHELRVEVFKEFMRDAAEAEDSIPADELEDYAAQRRSR